VKAELQFSPFSKGSAALAARDLILYFIFLKQLTLNLSSDLWTKVHKSPSLFTKERKKQEISL
jgi:hypothetical protein